MRELVDPLPTDAEQLRNLGDAENLHASEGSCHDVKGNVPS